MAEAQVCEPEPTFTVIEVRLPKSSEKTPDATAQLFASFSGLAKKKMFQFGPPASLSFEIACYDQLIHFLVVCPKNQTAYVESQIAGQYPESLITQLPVDYLEERIKKGTPVVAQLELASLFCLPIRTFRDAANIDLLASLLGTMSKAGPDDFMAIQILISRAGSWQGFCQRQAKGMVTLEGKSIPHPNAKFIEKKVVCPGFWTSIRLISNQSALIKTLTDSFSVYQSESNRLKVKKYFFAVRNYYQKKLLQSCLKRTFKQAIHDQVLNTDELASLWHPACMSLAGIKNIAWGKTMLTEPPINLPIVAELKEDEKSDVNFFARTEYKNKICTFGIKKKDRRRHVYIIGKSGTGKSTLIANMGINDLRNGEGMAVIDPHGDLTEILLDYIPSHRINDVCYLDPSQKGAPFHLNPLEVKNQAYKELVASNIVAIFYKLYAYTWGPRLEYILRNTILTLLETNEPTMLQIPDLLTNSYFRQKTVATLQDPILKSFWDNEFDKMENKQRNEAIAPILNKIGQFLTSPVIRPVIGTYHSTIDLEELMNTGKILLINLSQGKIGEDNAALLGSMIITQIQLAAMSRIYIPEDQRKDFFLYVDEFQNFATTSFSKILSEARKYRLDMILANQYIGQLEEGLQKAIFGNAGTLISFVVGSADAKAMAGEYGQIYKEEDLVSLGMYQIALKICIDNLTSAPFSATTLPLPRCKNENREKVLRVSQDKYNKQVEDKKPETVPSPAPLTQTIQPPKFPQFSQRPQNIPPSKTPFQTKFPPNPSASNLQNFSQPSQSPQTPPTSKVHVFSPGAQNPQIPQTLQTQTPRPSFNLKNRQFHRDGNPLGPQNRRPLRPPSNSQGPK